MCDPGRQALFIPVFFLFSSDITCFQQNTYNNIDAGTCDSCSSVCVGGCTGDGNFVGEGGCGLCDVIEVDADDNQVYIC